VFLMNSLNCFQVKMSVRCAEGGCGGGRNFLFAGRANQLIPACITPPPTLSPTAADEPTPRAPPVPSPWDHSPVNTCDCFDIFTSQAGGDYVLSNKYFDIGEGVDTQERRIEISKKNLYTDAVAFSINDEVFEIHGDVYYRNSHHVSLPIYDFGHGMASITKSFVSADTEEIMVNILGAATKLVVKVTSGTGPRKFIKLLERPA